jgi:hypothetical protein
LRAIFVNYRRHDSEGESGRLFDDLVEQFGEQSVFMDVAAIEVGRDFRKAIDESVASCGVLLAVIGLGWLDEKGESGVRRLDDPNDFVRAEIASALKRDIPLVPVLVRGARMPHADQLPEDIRDLAYRNAVELTHARWKSDIKLLIRSLRSLLGDSRDVLEARGIRSSLDPMAVDRSKIVDYRSAQGTGSNTPAQGSAVAAQSLASPSGVSVSTSNAGVDRAADCGCGANLDPSVLARITNELTDYIGPIAEVVVKRAARKCASVAELRSTVAEEIETTAERTKFLDACRTS